MKQRVSNFKYVEPTSAVCCSLIFGLCLVGIITAAIGSWFLTFLFFGASGLLLYPAVLLWKENAKRLTVASERKFRRRQKEFELAVGKIERIWGKERANKFRAACNGETYQTACILYQKFLAP